MKKLLTLFLVLFSILTASAQVRKYSNEFLQIGVGARALGMANSVVASSGDVFAGYWNPAGLTQMTSNVQVGYMHSDYFAGIAKYDFGGFAYRIDTNSAIALSALRFGVDNIPNTIDLIDNNGNINYDRITSFSAADYAFLASYARNLKVPGLAIGVNAKLIHRKVGDFGKAWGFGFDAGATYRYKKFTFGAMARDVTSTFNQWSYSLDERTKEVFTLTGNEIPSASREITLPKLILAANYKRPIAGKFSLAGEINADITFDGMRNVLIKSDPVSIDPHFGLEASYADLIFLRGGVGNIQEVKEVREISKTTFQPNMGVGISLKSFSLDYALTDIGDLSLSHVFSVKVNIFSREK